MTLILTLNLVRLPRAADDDAAPLPPSLNLGDDSTSLADILKADLLRRLKAAGQDAAAAPSRSHRVRRPRPEMGPGYESDEPVDISKYIGPDGDPQKTFERLQQLGKIPSASAPLPSPATDASDPFKDVPPEKRLAYAQDQLKRRHFEEGLQETEKALDSGLKGDALLDALVLREKCMFHQKFHGVVENDYYRLHSYFPGKPQVQELKNYLDTEAGLKPLQEQVLQHPTDPGAQRHLLDQYLRYDWLDFAEDFFAETIHDTSQATVESLSEIFFRKKDYPMLVQLSQAAQKMFPREAVFPYNEGVGLVSQGDAASLAAAQEAFQKARRLAKTPSMQQRADWYLGRLPGASKR